MRKIYLLLLSLFFFTNCESPFAFDVPDREFIVIDGYLTFDNESSEVRISRAINYNSGNFLFVSGASVYLYENGIELLQFAEIANGIFRSPKNLNYNIEARYQLHVVMQDGSHYMSIEESFPKPVHVDNIEWQLEDNVILSPDFGEIKDGLKLVLYGDFTFSELENQFLKWDYLYDYQLNTEFIIPDSTPVTVCYVSRKSGFIPDVISSNEKTALKGYQIGAEKIDFRFNHKAVFKIRALSIGQNSYDYYNAIHNQILNTGSLFDTTPARIDGGMRNADDPDEIVLGHFGFFNVSSQIFRIFNVDLGNKQEPINACYPIGELGNPQLFCYDCRKFGGAAILPPDDWEE